MSARGSSKVACVILAAGSSTRFGSPKQIAKINKIPMLQMALHSANSSNSDYVILVLGALSSEIVAELDIGRAIIAYNKGYSQGLSSSIKVGISNAPSDTNAVLLMVADQPFVTTPILNAIIASYKSKTSVGIVALSSGTEPRNPVLLDRKYFNEIEALQGDRGAKEVILRHLPQAQLLNVQDPKILLDIDTQDALNLLSEKE
jgi:molybdenum cofactor cytidylyltransferase